MTKNSAKDSIKELLSLPSKNRYPSRQEWEGACWKKILKSEKLLDLFVTPYERYNIVLRAATMELLNSGRGTRPITRELQISRQTVSSVKKTVKGMGYKSYRERGKTERKKKVYSHHLSQNKNRSYGGYYRRTKYGKVYMPY